MVMTKRNPRIDFNSPWPARLRALAAKDTLLISKEELTYQQVVSLVSNMNYRHKGKLIYRVDGHPDTDSIVTCLFHGHGVFKDGRTREARKFQKKERLQPAAGPATSSPVLRAAAEYTPAVAIVELLYGDGSITTLRAVDREDYDRLMSEAANNMLVVQVKVFALTHTKRRDFSWKDETAPING